MNYKNINPKDIDNFKNEIKNFTTERLKLLLSYIKLFKNKNHNLSDKELQLQSEYRKIIIGELVSRGKKKNQ